MTDDVYTDSRLTGLNDLDSLVIADALAAYMHELITAIIQGYACSRDIAEVWRANRIRNHILGGN